MKILRRIAQSDQDFSEDRGLLSSTHQPIADSRFLHSWIGVVGFDGGSQEEA